MDGSFVLKMLNTAYVTDETGLYYISSTVKIIQLLPLNYLLYDLPTAIVGIMLRWFHFTRDE